MAESLVAPSPLGHPRDLGLGEMNLPRPSPFGRGEVLRDVSLALVAAASLVPADTTTLADGAPDQSSALGEHTLDVLLPLSLKGEQSLAQAALVVRHAK
jgi:hypothetical protein